MKKTQINAFFKLGFLVCLVPTQASALDCNSPPVNIAPHRVGIIGGDTTLRSSYQNWQNVTMGSAAQNGIPAVANRSDAALEQCRIEITEHSIPSSCNR